MVPINTVSHNNICLSHPQFSLAPLVSSKLALYHPKSPPSGQVPWVDLGYRLQTTHPTQVTEFLSSDVPTTSCPTLDLRTLPVLVLSYWPGNPYHPPRFRQRPELATEKSVFFTHSETKLKYTLNCIRVITRCQQLTPGAIFSLIPRLPQ